MTAILGFIVFVAIPLLLIILGLVWLWGGLWLFGRVFSRAS